MISRVFIASAVLVSIALAQQLQPLNRNNDCQIIVSSTSGRLATDNNGWAQALNTNKQLLDQLKRDTIVIEVGSLLSQDSYSARLANALGAGFSVITVIGKSTASSTTIRTAISNTVRDVVVSLRNNSVDTTEKLVFVVFQNGGFQTYKAAAKLLLEAYTSIPIALQTNLVDYLPNLDNSVETAEWFDLSLLSTSASGHIVRTSATRVDSLIAKASPALLNYLQGGVYVATCTSTSCDAPTVWIETLKLKRPFCNSLRSWFNACTEANSSIKLALPVQVNDTTAQIFVS